MSARTAAPTRARLRAHLAAAAALAVVLAGCSDKSAPDTTAPAGYKVVRNASTGFALAVPADWIEIHLTQDLDEFDERARAQTQRNDALTPAINSARQIAQSGGKFMAVSPDGNARVNLTVDEAQEETLDELAAAIVPVLQESGATEVRQDRATTGAGDALRLSFKFPLPGRGQETVVADEVQYYVIHDDKTFVLTVINGPPDLSESVAGSLRLR
ncbi:MAG: hypothetical protein ACLGI2_15895 [Acidimicrobiia bacterium]